MSDIEKIYRLKAHLRVVPVSEDVVYLLGERARIGLSGSVYAQLVPLLNGQHTVMALAKQLKGQVPAAEVFYALNQLKQDGFIVEGAPPDDLAAAAWWEASCEDALLAQQRVRACTIAVEAGAGLDEAPLLSAMASVGIAAATSNASVRLLLTSDYCSEAVTTSALEARRMGQHVMLVKPVGAVPWIGPILAPEHAPKPGSEPAPEQPPEPGPCIQCLTARLRANQPVVEFAQQVTNWAPQVATHPSAQQFAYAFAAQRLLNWSMLGQSAPAGVPSNNGPQQRGAALYSVDLQSLQTVAHQLRRRPQCPGCGDPDLMTKRAEKPVVMASVPKQFTADGGHRCISPEETWERYQHLVSPITGVVASLGPMPGGEHPMRQVFGGAYYVRPTFEAPELSEFSRVSTGKGRSAAQARVSAFAEAIERYSAVYQGDEPRIRASLNELGEDAIHPSELLNFSQHQYASAKEVNATTRDYRRAIPHQARADQQLDWSPAWSLTNNCRRYLPTSYCYAYVPTPADEVVCYHNPNGHAAGNCLEEAVVQAFMELVERDAVAIWWYNRLVLPQVDLTDFGRPWLAELQAHYAELGWKLWVLDLTTDLNVPVFTALARNNETGRFCVGFGAHFDAALAVQRALTELNQIYQLEGAGRQAWDAHLIGEQPYLFPDSSVPARGREAFAAHKPNNDLAEDVRACVERASRAGLEVLVLDQTRPDIGMSVAKVAVPGLRHFWPRYGPGRLYEVPVKMGVRDVPLTEQQLHPQPIYL